MVGDSQRFMFYFRLDQILCAEVSKYRLLFYLIYFGYNIIYKKYIIYKNDSVI